MSAVWSACEQMRRWRPPFEQSGEGRRFSAWTLLEQVWTSCRSCTSKMTQSEVGHPILLWCTTALLTGASAFAALDRVARDWFRASKEIFLRRDEKKRLQTNGHKEPAPRAWRLLCMQIARAAQMLENNILRTLSVGERMDRVAGAARNLSVDNRCKLMKSRGFSTLLVGARGVTYQSWSPDTYSVALRHPCADSVRCVGVNPSFSAPKLDHAQSIYSEVG